MDDASRNAASGDGLTPFARRLAKFTNKGVADRMANAASPAPSTPPATPATAASEVPAWRSRLDRAAQRVDGPAPVVVPRPHFKPRADVETRLPVEIEPSRDDEPSTLSPAAPSPPSQPIVAEAPQLDETAKLDEPPLRRRAPRAPLRRDPLPSEERLDAAPLAPAADEQQADESQRTVRVDRPTRGGPRAPRFLAQRPNLRHRGNSASPASGEGESPVESSPAKSSPVEATSPLKPSSAATVVEDASDALSPISPVAELALAASASVETPLADEAPATSADADPEAEVGEGCERDESKSYFKWGYILPRAVALASVAALLTIFAGSIVAFSVRVVGERIVRAKVDIGESTASWTDARVDMKNVAVANRRRPGKNLFSFESGVLDFDAFKLLNGQYIVDEARLSGLRFDTDRSDDGRSDFVRLRDIEIPLPEIDLKDLGIDRLKKSLGEFSLRGVAAVQERLEQEVLSTQLESLVALQKARAFWTSEYLAWQARAKSVKDRIDMVRQTIEGAKQVPLAERVLKYQAAARDLVALLEELQAAQVRIAELPTFVKRDMAVVAEAAKRDAANIRDRLKAPFVEAQKVADKLLGHEMEQRLEHLAAGIRFVRGIAAPLEDESLEPPPTYGRTFDFPLDEVLPRFLVRKLEVDGVVDLAGTPTKFVGSIDNLTTCPRKLGRPTLVHLKLDGVADVELEATIDRTTPTRRDHVRVVASKIKMPKRTIGDPDDFAVHIGGCEATLELEVVLVDDQLDARFIWKQPACSMAFALGNLADKPWAAELCSCEMSNIDFTATITATGPIASPEWNLATNLGEALCPHMQGIFDSRMASVRDHVCGKIEALAQSQLGDLESLLEKERQGMLDKLLNGSGAIAEFRDLAAREFPQLQLASLDGLKTAGVDFAEMKKIELQQKTGELQQRANSVIQQKTEALQQQTDALQQRAMNAVQSNLPSAANLPAGVNLPNGVNVPLPVATGGLAIPAVTNFQSANPLGIQNPLPNGFNPGAMLPQQANPANPQAPVAPSMVPLEAKRFFR